MKNVSVAVTLIRSEADRLPKGHTRRCSVHREPRWRRRGFFLRTCSRPSLHWLHAVRHFPVRRGVAGTRQKRRADDDSPASDLPVVSLAGSGPPFDPYGCTRYAHTRNPSNLERGVSVAELVKRTLLFARAPARSAARRLPPSSLIGKPLSPYSPMALIFGRKPGSRLGQRPLPSSLRRLDLYL